MMKNLQILFRRTEFHILLFLMSIIFFSWPLLFMANKMRPTVIFLSFFITWGLIIGVIYLMSMSYPDEAIEAIDEKKDSGKGEDLNV